MPNSLGNKKHSNSNSSTQKPTQKLRKRMRPLSTDGETDLEAESASAIEKKLRSDSKMNSLSDVEMKKLIRKLVANDQILAFITLKAEDELAKEKNEKKNIHTAAVIVNDVDASVPKLTRAKARELKKQPLLSLTPFVEPHTSEIATLIQADLHSDEDDEEYTFKEEDFVSDDDPHMTLSDVDSQPRTPATSVTLGPSPQKFSSDGVFKIPPDMDLDAFGDEIIATRTRSKFCLQQTTIEDLQSGFIPPDDHIDVPENEIYGNDEDWMEFLNEFSKPLAPTSVGDEDDPVNDPEYIAAEKVPLDAEELRNVNISKKELTDLVAELFEGLLQEGVSMESIELQTPDMIKEIQDESQNSLVDIQPKTPLDIQISDATISSSNYQVDDCSMNTQIITTTQVEPTPVYQAVQTFSAPDPGQSSSANTLNNNYCFEVSYTDPNTTVNHSLHVPILDSSKTTDNTEWFWSPSQVSGTYEHAFDFSKYKHIKVRESNLSNDPVGFTANQYELLQQQLRIHVQLLTQNFLQTYLHSYLWKRAVEQKELLMELADKAKVNPVFNVWNLQPALQLIHDFESELDNSPEESRRLIGFIEQEVEKANPKRHDVCRFPPLVMKRILGSRVFMYPEYLPKIPFIINTTYRSLVPSEAYLISLGLEKYLNDEKMETCSNLKRKKTISQACDKMIDTYVFEKMSWRIKDVIRDLQTATGNNPIKYYFEHGRSPPVEHNLILIDFANILPPEDREMELPRTWKDFLIVLKAGLIVNNTYPASYSRWVRKLKAESSDHSLETSGYPCCRKRYPRIRGTPNANPLTINIKYVFKQPQENLPVITDDYVQSVLNLSQVQKVNQTIVLPTTPNHPCDKSLHGAHSPELHSDCDKKDDINITVDSVNQDANLKSKRTQGKHFRRFISKYRLKLEKQLSQYRHPSVSFVYRHCRTLELYTNLLDELKMNCRKAKGSDDSMGSSKKKLGTEEQDLQKTRKANRQEESLRHMLLPDSAEDINRKDAIYAYNFYEKVQEIFKQSDRPDDCKKFNQILKSFNPKTDKVSDLYYKLEKLFLPDHPELAQVFLTFLLPSEAAEIGKFFEHFMCTNAGTFFNKLNVYFSKQPAQIRKIYNCIRELSEQTDLTMEAMKAKIFPLLKGNTFLIDWFTQLFTNEQPPDRLFSSTENVSMKEILTNQSGEYVESLQMSDLMDSPNESQTCQLKYINGRVFYGTKIPLPAKLAFMAKSYTAEDLNDALDEEFTGTESGCVHGIREFGEKRLSSTTDDNDRSEEEDSKLEIDSSPVDEQHYEICDDASLRAHAIRLNPSYYSSSCYTSSTGSSFGSSIRPLKTASSAGEDGKCSPRKAMAVKTSSSTGTASGSSTFKERRKSPKKNIIRSPLSNSKRAVAADGSTKSNAIATAKKLKIYIETDPNSDMDNSRKKCSRKKKEAGDSEGSDGEVKANIPEIKNEPTAPWTRDEDKIILEEMKSGFKDHCLHERISLRASNRTRTEIEERCKFLDDFLSKLKGSNLT